MKKTLLLLVPFIVLLLLAPAAGQLTPVQVTDNSYDDYNPQIAIDPSGNAYLTWVGYEGGSDSEIFWAGIDSSGTVTTVQVTDNSYDYSPQIAVDSSGNSYLTWYGFDGNNWEIFWAKVNSSGTVTGPLQITNTYDNSYPQIAIDSSGNSYLVWEGYDGNDNEIFWAKVDSTGVVTGPVQVTANSGNIYPKIAIDSSGNSYLTWCRYDGSDFEVFWAKVSSTGAVTGPLQITDTYGNSSPQIAVDSSGNSYMTWYGFDGNDWEIFWAKVDSTGVVTGPLQITTNSHNDYKPQIAIDSSGNSYLTWYLREDECVNNIFWVKVDSTGVVTSPVRITDDLYDNLDPQIAVDSSGNSYLTWYGGGSDFEIFWAKLDPSGTLSTIVQVTTNPYYDGYSQIALDSSGNSYLTWYGAEGGSDYEIFFLCVAGTGTSSPSPLIFKVLADTQLARANVMWECISGNLPADITAEIQEMIDAVQTHMANAASLSNPIYSNGELVKAIDIMKNISEALGLECE